MRTHVFGEGTPLLFLHGFGVDHNIFNTLKPQVPQGWQQIYFDLPGAAGQKVPPEIDSSEAVVSLILSWIDNHLHGQEFAIVGNSWGGMLARAVAARRREQILGLCLLCPVVVADPNRRQLPAIEVFEEDHDFLASLPVEQRNEFIEMSVFRTEAAWKKFTSSVTPGLHSADWSGLGQISKKYDLEVNPEDSGPFYAPTLIITGRQDIAVGYKDALRLEDPYPHGTIIVFDQAGHNTHLEQTSITNQLFADWLHRVKSSQNQVIDRYPLIGGHQNTSAGRR